MKGAQGNQLSIDQSLQPLTEPGRLFIELAERHTKDFATRAEEHDRAGSFPFENIKDLQASRCAAACLPSDLGGLEVRSLRDLAVGVSRLGRGDGSTAIGMNMHLAATWTLVHLHHLALESGDEQRARPLGRLLRWVASEDAVLAILATEPGTQVLFPLAEACRHKRGWQVSGRKSFATLSPAADLFFVHVKVVDGERVRLGIALVPRNTRGLEVRDNWDGLGMRASGSNDVVLEACRLPDAMLLPLGAWGEADSLTLTNLIVAGLGLVGAFLGIAETAQAKLIERARSGEGAHSARGPAERHETRRLVAENEIALAASRAMLERTAVGADALLDAAVSPPLSLDPLHQVMKDLQCTKWFVNRAAIEIVDRALTGSGGGAYLSTSPLSRLYRDVRAGPFMQPYSPLEALDHIAEVTLGMDPRPKQTGWDG